VSYHLVAKFQPGVTVSAVAAEYGVRADDRVPGTLLYGLRVPPKADPKAILAKLNADPRLVYAEPDYLLSAPEGADGNPFHFPTDRRPTKNIYLSQPALSQVAAVSVGSPTPGGAPGPAAVPNAGAGVIVAVLDTGVTANHPALAGRILSGYNALNPSRAPQDLPDGTTNGAVGHGTMVAGIIARIAPGARILPVRVLNADGVGSLLSVAKGIEYAVARGARVLNFSLGMHTRSEALKEALDTAEAAGIVIVAAAGNDNVEAGQFPALGKGGIAVAAVDVQDIRAPFSNYGSWVRVSAPGVDVVSAYWDGTYATWSGTSFAAPFVAGEAAVVLSKRPTLTADGVKEIVRNTARSIDAVNPRYRGKLGKGIIDIAGALKRVP
jgi:subtilisin family serine protease